MEILWSLDALRDIGKAIDFLEQRSPNAAEEVEEHVLKAVEKLSSFPHMGRPGRVDGTRELVIRRYPYIVIYSVGTSRVNILRLMHTAQAWTPSKDQDVEDNEK